MSAFSKTDEVSADELEKIQIRNRRVRQEDPGPGAFDGFTQLWKVPISGGAMAVGGFESLFNLPAKANETYAGIAYNLTPGAYGENAEGVGQLYHDRMRWSSDLVKENRAWAAEYYRQADAYYKGEQGFATQTVRTVGEIIPRAIFGNKFGVVGSAMAVGLPEGGAAETRLTDRGVAPDVAADAGNLTATTMGAMAAFPAAGLSNSLLADFGLVIGGNVTLGATQRKAMNELLKDTPEIAAQYQALDTTALATDVLLTMPFWGLARMAGTSPQAKAQLVDQALTVKANEQANTTQGYAPETPKDVAAVRRNKAYGIEALLNDQPMPEPEAVKAVEMPEVIAEQKQFADSIAEAIRSGDIDGIRLFEDAPSVETQQAGDAFSQRADAIMGRIDGAIQRAGGETLYNAVEYVESRGKVNAVSPKGAVGPMQTMPDTLRDPGYGVRPAKDGSVAELRRVGRDYVDAMTAKYGIEGGLAAYNWGPGNWEKALKAAGGDVQKALASAPAETRAYVPRVLARIPGAMDTFTNGVPKNLPEVEADVREINSSLSKFTAAGPDGAAQTHRGIRPIDQGSLPDELAAALRATDEALGIQTAVVRNLSPEIRDFHGTTLGDGRVFVNEDTPHPVVTVAMHEFGHNLETRYPDLYEPLRAEIERQSKDGGLAFFKRDSKQANDGLALRELTNNSIGDALSDPKFLRRMADENPSAFQKVATAVMDYLDKLLAKVGLKDYGSDRYLEDVTIFRDMLATTLNEYAMRTGGMDERSAVLGLADEIGWEQQGGNLVYIDGMADGVNGQGGGMQVTGRTKWIPRMRKGGGGLSDFWTMRPDGITEATARKALAKYAEGKKLGAAEQRFIDYAKKQADIYESERRQAFSEYMRVEAERREIGFSDKVEPPEGAALRDRVENDWESVKKEYAALPDTEGGRVLNTDDMREISPEYRADRSKSANVHEASSDAVKKLYAEKLSNPTPAGAENTVMLSAGGTGAGKTSGIRKMGDKLGNPEITYDTNMNKLASSVQKIDQAIAAKRAVRIIYTYRDPVDALVNGALTRASRMEAKKGSGRTVPLSEHLKTHVGASEVIRQLVDIYADNPMVDFRFIDNTKGAGNQELVALADLPKVEENGLYEKLDQALEAEYAAGRISEAIYRGFKEADGAAASSGTQLPVGTESTDGSGRSTDSGQPAPADGQQVSFSDKLDDGFDTPADASPEEAAAMGIARANPGAKVNFGGDLDGTVVGTMAEAVRIIQDQKIQDVNKAKRFGQVVERVIAGKPLSEAEIKVSDTIAAKYRDLEKSGDKAFLEMAKYERIQHAAEMAGKDAEILAAKAAQRRAASLIAQQSNVERVMARAPELKGKKNKVHEAVFERLGQIASRIEGQQSAARADMIGALEATAPRFLGMVRDTRAMRDFAREVLGQNSGNKDAAAAAKAYLDVIENMRVKANSLGTNIGKLSYGWLPHQWDQGMIAHGGRSLSQRVADRVAGKEYTAADARAEYVKDMLENTDLSVLRNEDGTVMDEADATAFYESAFDTLFTDGLNKQGQTGPGTRASKYDGKHRVIHFKDADSYMAMMDKYGGGRDLMEAIMGHLDSMAKDIAMLDELGANPRQTFDLLKETAEGADLARGVYSDGATLDNVFDVMNGEVSTPVNAAIAKVGQGARNLTTAVALQGVMLSSIGDAPMQALVAKSYGIDVSKNIKTTLGAFGGDTAKEAARLGIVTDYLSNEMALWGGDGVSMAGWTGRLAETTMRLTGVNRWTHSMRRGGELQLAMGITDWVKNDFESLSPKTRENFAQAGVTEADWKIWQKATASQFKGVDILDFRDIQRVDDPGAYSASMRYLGLLDDFGKLAVYAPDVRVRAALTQGTKSGTIGGEIARSMTLFKSFALGMPLRHLRRMRQMDNPGRAKYAAAYVIGLTTFGALAIQLKQLANGKDPLDITEGKFWASALAQGGGLGILFDLIYGGIDSEGRTGRQNWRALSSPVFSKAMDIAELTTEAGYTLAGSKSHERQFRQHLARFVSDNTPFTKIWWYKEAVNQLVGHEMRESISPGYVQKERARAAKYGETYYIKPNGDIRAPDFDKAIGE